MQTASDDSPIALFLHSETAGRWHFTTLGMHGHGLPELQMRQVAANHCRAVRFLMTIIGRRLVAQKNALGDLHQGIDLTLSRADVLPQEPFLCGERVSDTAVGGSVRVRLQLQPMAQDDSGNGNGAELLAIVPPMTDEHDADAWLRETCRCLGQNTPVARPSAAQFDAMQAASESARASLAEMRRRFSAGLGEQKLLIKTGLPTRAGGREYVWVEVTGWTDEAIVGSLIVSPHDLPGHRLGQEMKVAEADVFDRAITSAAGTIEPALTDIVAQDYGIDIQDGDALSPSRIGWRAFLLLAALVILRPLLALFSGIARFFRGSAPESEFDMAQVEKAAHDMVDSCKRLNARRSEYIPTSNDEYDRARVARYDEVERALAAVEMPALGDVADARFNRENVTQRGFYRMGRSLDERIAWSYFVLVGKEAATANGGKEPGTLVLRTWLDDGRLLTTVRLDNPSLDIYPPAPHIEVERLPPGTSEAEVARAHRTRVAAVHVPTLQLTNLATICDLLLQQEELTARFRQSLGVELYRTLVINSQGEQGRPLANAIASTIEAHPEWL